MNIFLYRGVLSQCHYYLRLQLQMKESVCVCVRVCVCCSSDVSVCFRVQRRNRKCVRSHTKREWRTHQHEESDDPLENVKHQEWVHVHILSAQLQLTREHSYIWRNYIFAQHVHCIVFCIDLNVCEPWLKYEQLIKYSMRYQLQPRVSVLFMCWLFIYSPSCHSKPACYLFHGDILKSLFEASILKFGFRKSFVF